MLRNLWKYKREKVVHNTVFQYIEGVNNNKNAYNMHDLRINFQKFYELTKQYFEKDIDKGENLCIL